MDWHLLGNGVVTFECALILAWFSRIGVKGLRKLPVPVLIAFLSLASGTSIVAQKTNGVNNIPPVPMPPRSAPVVDTVKEDDVARGWRVESVTTNETFSFAMPSNASYVGNWHVHGARSSFGKNIIDFGSAGTPRPTSWSFPLGTNGAAFSSFRYRPSRCFSGAGAWAFLHAPTSIRMDLWCPLVSGEDFCYHMFIHEKGMDI
jgi:hypothetical protein